MEAKSLHVRSFGQVIKAIRKAKSVRTGWSNGDSVWTFEIVCPDRVRTHMADDTGSKVSRIQVGTRVWDEVGAGKWQRQPDAAPFSRRGTLALIFPDGQTVKSAVRGNVEHTMFGDCEWWKVDTELQGVKQTYDVCVGKDKLPLFVGTKGQLFFSTTFGAWNEPLNITEPPVQ